MEKQGKLEICIDFGESGVIKKSERPVWNAFRIWESVNWPVRQNTNYYLKFKRTINTSINPPVDIFSDWIMDFATIAAFQLGRIDWENFRNLVLIQVPDCPSTCWYCFNDAWKKNSKCTFGAVTAKEIIEKFLLQQEQNKALKGRKNNVLRISGGEPFTQPELIKDIALEIGEQVGKGNDIFLWVDTNLMLIKDRPEINNALDALSKNNKNVAVHACFHGVTDSSIKKITGKDTKITDLIQNYMHMKKFDINVYPRFNPCACTPSEAEEFFMALYKEDKLGPAKLYMGIVELYYEASRKRLRDVIEESKNGEREYPIYHSPQATTFWWDRAMYSAYGVGYGIIPRHMGDCLTYASDAVLRKRITDMKEERPDKEFILVSKGFYRENYALKVLESLALPDKFNMVLELENKYVEPNFHYFVSEYPEAYVGKPILIVATDSYARDISQMVFLRWGRIKEVWTTPSSTNVNVKLDSYPYLEFDKQDAHIGNKEKSIGVENYERIAKYIGKRNLPIGGYYLQLAALPTKVYPVADDKPTETKQGEYYKNAFFQIVDWLNEFKRNPRIYNNIYYRVFGIYRVDNNVEIEPDENGILEFRPGDDIEIKLDSYNPYLGRPGYPREDQAILSVSCTAEENIRIVSPAYVRLSKFGQPKIKLRVEHNPEETKGEIVIKSAIDSSEIRIIELRIPFITRSIDI